MGLHLLSSAPPRLLRAVLFGWVACAASASPARADDEPLTCTRRQGFHLRAQVLTVNEGRTRQLYLFDGRAFHHLWDRSGGEPPCQCGDVVDVDGFHDPDSRLHPHHVATRIQFVRTDPMPETAEVSVGQLNASAARPSPVAVRGVLCSAVRDDIDSQLNWLTLNTSDGKIVAAATENEYPLGSLRALVDAEVTLRGISDWMGSWRRPRTTTLILFGRDGLRVDRPVPENPFGAVAAEAGVLHRQLRHGTVIGTAPNRVFMVTESGKFHALLCADGQSRPDTGKQIAALGFIIPAPGEILLAEALVRETDAPAQTLAPAERIDTRQLFTDESGHRLANTRFCGKIIRIRGTVEDSSETIAESGTAKIGVRGGLVTLDLTNLRNACPPDFGRGYEIDAAGVCCAEFERPLAEAFPKFTGFTLYPRGPDDLVILRSPPWWTPLRLMIVIGLLLVAIFGILLWNRTLRRLSERRGRELAREQLQHAKSELKVEERTRLAVELHDSISQTLTGVALQIDAASGTADRTAANRLLSTACALLNSCRQELRCCIWDLRSRTFEEKDMTEAVEQTLAPHLGDVRAIVRFNVPCAALSERSAHDVLRIIRELALNAIRHGAARTIRIAGELRRGRLRFSVRDDGRGFDVPSAPGPVQGHFGLHGIRERLHGRNGTLEIESASGRGTRATVTFSVEPTSDES